MLNIADNIEILIPQEIRRSGRHGKLSNGDATSTYVNPWPHAAPRCAPDTGSGPTEPTLETHYAESEIQNLGPENSLFFGSIRHNSHYFPVVEPVRPAVHRLGYPAATELPVNRSRKSPQICLTRLSFSLDLRSTMDRMCLRARRHLHSLHDVTIDLTGGEATALLYTNETEVHTLLHLLAARHPPEGRFRGEISMNGHILTLKQFARRAAHVPIDAPPSDLTVLQYLKFMSYLEQPATAAFRLENMIDQLIKTLCLSQVKHRLLKNLSEAEKQRAKIAVAILKDTDILIVDNALRDLDVYEVAFIVDYLRDWAVKLNRIILMAIAPTNMETLLMFHKTVLLASGRIIYADWTHKLIPYFERHNFPCPALKNPCDYYVDLVTHDHLSAASSKESAARIRYLADLWKRERPVLNLTTIQTVCPPINPAGFLFKVWVLLRRQAWVAVNHPCRYASELLLALLFSCSLGVLCYDLPTDKRAGIEDRFGLAIGLFLFLPLLLGFWNISQVHAERHFVYGDVKSGLYGPKTHVISKVIFDLPSLFCIVLFAAFPAMTMSGITEIATILHPQNLVNLAILTILILLHLGIFRYLAWNLAHFFRGRTMAFGIYALLLLGSNLSSGLLVRSQDQQKFAQNLRVFSPTFWAAQPFLETIFIRKSQLHAWIQNDLKPGLQRPNSSQELIFDCEKHNILAAKFKEVPIYTVAQCAKIRATHALYAAGFVPYKVQDVSAIQIQPKNTEKPFFVPTTRPPDLTAGVIVYCFYFALTSSFLFFAASFNHRPRMD
ncbi:unnamed protein product, partial [Mesorhabditis spiculigera]